MNNLANLKPELMKVVHSSNSDSRALVSTQLQSMNIYSPFSHLNWGMKLQITFVFLYSVDSFVYIILIYAKFFRWQVGAS